MITFNEVKGTVEGRIRAVKSSGFTPDATIQSMPISTGQSYILANSPSAIFQSQWETLENTLAGWDAVNGIWTLQQPGYYNFFFNMLLSAKTDADLQADLEIGDFGAGSIIGAFIGISGGGINTSPIFFDYQTRGVAGNPLSVAVGRESVINVSTGQFNLPLPISYTGTSFRMKMLNKLQLAYTQSINTVNPIQYMELIIEKVVA